MRLPCFVLLLLSALWPALAHSAPAALCKPPSEQVLSCRLKGGALALCVTKQADQSLVQLLVRHHGRRVLTYPAQPQTFGTVFKFEQAMAHQVVPEAKSFTFSFVQGESFLVWSDSGVSRYTHGSIPEVASLWTPSKSYDCVEGSVVSDWTPLNAELY